MPKVPPPSPLAAPELLHPGHPAWPESALRDLQKPPSWLEISGQLPDLRGAVAIVGTRFCDPWGVAFTRSLAAELAGAGRTIVSGGALGIDTAAHEGALAAGGATVVVVPTGIESAYPHENRPLFARICERGGCLLSEGGRKGPPKAHSFLDRNRLIAALAEIVVVVQAPAKSGALSTARHARALGRPLLAVPAAPWDSRGEGCLLLLSEGARICRTAADVLSLSACGAATGTRPSPRNTPEDKQYQDFEVDERAILKALERGPRGADELCEDMALPASQVQRAVLMLLLKGVIREVGSGRYEHARDC